MNSEQQENWYLAILVLQSSSQDAADFQPSVDLQHTLVKAANIEEAYTEAMRLGRENEHLCPNLKGEMVSWKFAGLAELDDIYGPRPEHGVEVYGYIRDGSADEYVIPKEKLTVFWGEANKDKTVEELLDQLEDQPHAD